MQPVQHKVKDLKPEIKPPIEGHFQQARPLSILLAEDNAVNQMVLLQILPPMVSTSWRPWIGRPMTLF